MTDSKLVQVDVNNVKIDKPRELRGGVYSNTVSMEASNSEIVFNFMYLNPSDEPQATLVSRVIVPHALLELLNDQINIVTKELKKKGDK